MQLMDCSAASICTWVIIPMQLYTDKALEAPYAILDYNSYANADLVPVYDLNPEVLWQRAAVSGSPIFMIYSQDLNSYFNSSDIRYSFLTVTNNDGLRPRFFRRQIQLRHRVS